MSGELDELQKIAEEATPGERTRLAGHQGRFIGNESVRVITGRCPAMFRVETADPQHHRDAAYLATFSPHVVLDLIARARRLEDIERAVRLSEQADQ